MCIVRERRPAGFLDMKCQTCFKSSHSRVIILPGLYCLILSLVFFLTLQTWEYDIALAALFKGKHYFQLLELYPPNNEDDDQRPQLSVSHSIVE